MYLNMADWTESEDDSKAVQTPPLDLSDITFVGDVSEAIMDEDGKELHLKFIGGYTLNVGFHFDGKGGIRLWTTVTYNKDEDHWDIWS